MQGTNKLQLRRLPAGTYVVAVSGGVDSMSLLDILADEGVHELIVAHFDHGIRADSHLDLELVREASRRYGVPFVSETQSLKGASEATARAARYRFLHEVLRGYTADAIVTAHHLDDRLETMLLNQQRGAGWRGLAPLHETALIKRPLLEVPKQELYDYARGRNLKWREDETNADPNYTPRNRIRQEMQAMKREELLARLQDYDRLRQHRQQRARQVLSSVVADRADGIAIDRTSLLVHDVETVRDTLFALLQDRFGQDMEVDFDAVVRLEHFYKTATARKRLNLSSRVWAQMEGNVMVVSVPIQAG